MPPAASTSARTLSIALALTGAWLAFGGGASCVVNDDAPAASACHCEFSATTTRKDSTELGDFDTSTVRIACGATVCRSEETAFLDPVYRRIRCVANATAEDTGELCGVRNEITPPPPDAGPSPVDAGPDASDAAGPDASDASGPVDAGPCTLRTCVTDGQCNAGERCLIRRGGVGFACYFEDTPAGACAAKPGTYASPFRCAMDDPPVLDRAACVPVACQETGEKPVVEQDRSCL